jgi:hypothetical protein
LFALSGDVYLQFSVKQLSIIKQLGYQIKRKKDEKIQRILFACNLSKVENIEATIHHKFGLVKSSSAPLHSFYKSWFSVIDKANQKKMVNNNTSTSLK